MVASLVSLGLLEDDSTVLRNSTGGELLQDFVKLMLVGSGISIEIATLLVCLIFKVVLIGLGSDSFEAAKSLELLSVDVHVVDLWLLDTLELLLLGHLLLEHFHLLLVLLDTHIDAVSKDISINDLSLGDGKGSLLVSKASSSLLLSKGN